MDVKQIKERLTKPEGVVRQNVSMYPEIRSLAASLGGGNISKGVTLALIEKMEQEGLHGARSDKELAVLLRHAADRLDKGE